jgi:hypothetical protein
MEGLKETAPSGPLWARLAVALGRQVPQQIKHWAHRYVVLRKVRDALWELVGEVRLVLPGGRATQDWHEERCREDVRDTPARTARCAVSSRDDPASLVGR